MRVRVGVGVSVRVGVGVGVRIRVRVRKLLASVPLEAVRHRALQPRDRAALLLGQALVVSG